MNIRQVRNILPGGTGYTKGSPVIEERKQSSTRGSLEILLPDGMHCKRPDGTIVHHEEVWEYDTRDQRNARLRAMAAWIRETDFCSCESGCECGNAYDDQPEVIRQRKVDNLAMFLYSLPEARKMVAAIRRSEKAAEEMDAAYYEVCNAHTCLMDSNMGMAWRAMNTSNQTERMCRAMLQGLQDGCRRAAEVILDGAHNYEMSVHAYQKGIGIDDIDAAVQAFREDNAYRLADWQVIRAIDFDGHKFDIKPAQADADEADAA